MDPQESAHNPLLREAAVDRLREIAKNCNTKGWDSYDAEPVRVETYALALNLLDAIMTALPAPAIGPSNEGAIVFELDGNGGSYEVEVSWTPA